MARQPKSPKQVETLTHDEATRKNIPTAELQSVAQRMEEREPVAPVHYPRAHPLAEGETRPRDGDLDPQIIWNGISITLTPDQIEELTRSGRIELGEAQLVWRGKDTQDWSDLIVQAPPLYIQEKIHPKAIIDDLKRQTEARNEADNDAPDLFADFNGIDLEAKTEFYQHDQHWANRMILGDSLQVMASLAEREQLRGQVQCIYFDPPYGIKFNSNWQVSTQSRDVKDGKIDQITREPEQVKAFRDTWKDGIHSYLTYLRDRLTVMRDLLTDSGSIFVQIGDENVHRVRAVMDEVFGEENFISLIAFTKGATGLGASGRLAARLDYIIWYGKQSSIKFRQLYDLKDPLEDPNFSWLETTQGKLIRRTQASEEDVKGGRFAQDVSLTKPGPGAKYEVKFCGRTFTSGNRWWGTPKAQLETAIRSGRIIRIGNSLRHLRYLEESGITAHGNLWDGFLGQSSPVYVVQTNIQIVQRCILMATDPGDLVLDPTCGSGTTATVAEQWGRRWITIDTSRVALALARTRLMAARYPYYYLADSPEGRAQEQKISGRIQGDAPTHGDIRQGFVYERAPHITLKSIANNAEIDIIWEKWQETLEPLRAELNAALSTAFEEWEIPRDLDDWQGSKAGAAKAGLVSPRVRELHGQWWEARIARQKEIDASIAQKADVEMLYDRPYEDKSRVRVAGPFTVESLSPHRVIPADEDDDYLASLLDGEAPLERPRHSRDAPEPEQDFAQMVLENLRSAGVHQTAKEDRITFTSIEPWPGDRYICAEGRYLEGETEKKAGIFIGPEFGTVTRADLTAAAREAHDARFDVLIACGFNFDAHTSEFNRLGPLPVLKAKMNPDLHMSDELKNTGAGNLFVVFGEPDIEWKFTDTGEIVVEVLGVDVFDPKTGEVRASGKDDIAAWFIDTDYDEESFFVRHAYFMGANDPYKSLKTALRAEIDEDAWATLYRDTSRPFAKPTSGRFAVKVINHFGDEVMKVFGV
ncbi:site-specific DNA-methyltransferase [Stappia indica]|uniref:site-specific DNA-methyltransferase n=1 Tax=Stappia indica TaxID=538381 RepID=UPI00082B5F2F|nr:site-specific DNA-methyltransferase [Stappia indica]